MELFTICEEALERGMNRAMERFTVVAPVRKGPEFAFEAVTAWAKAVPEAIGTILPPKKHAFPQCEPMLKFAKTDAGYTAESVLEEEAVILAGVHPCDIAGMRCLDQTFAGPNYDDHYGLRRRGALILGFDCMPDAHCFCASVGNLVSAKGFDLFFTPVRPSGYAIEVGTAKGREWMGHHLESASAAGAYEESLVDDFRKAKRDAMQLALDLPVEDLPSLYDSAMASQVWDRWAEKCLSCGACNFVCPTCYCFDVRDRTSLDGSSGTRSRVWDGCMLREFAEVAGGHNFRPTARGRLLHRHNRKFNYQFERYGMPHCTGCGRCERACLVNIGMVPVANELAAERGGEVA